ncbi:MAG: OmpA family protein [Pseudomonadota bacterium]
MARIAASALVLALAAATPAAGFEFAAPPGSVQTGVSETALDTYALPTGPFSTLAAPVRRLEGAVTRSTWRSAQTFETTQGLLNHFRGQALGADFEILFECEARACGGFDFRFGTEVARPPEMEVNLSDFRFFSAVGREGRSEIYTTALVSRVGASDFVQTVVVTVPIAAPVTPPGPDPVADDAVEQLGAGELGTALSQNGYAVLEGVDFAAGSAQLAPGEASSIAALAALLAEEPALRVALVGHTDATGPLPSNITISRERAAAVRQRLIEVHDVDPARVRAEGVGYLAPRTSNTTAEGRRVNRRVEVVVLK